MWTALLCSVLAVFLARVLWRRWKYDLHKVPSPPGLPIVGHILSFVYGDAITDFVKWMGKTLKSLDYPKLMRLDIMGLTLLVVNDEHFLRTVMFSNKDPFPRVVEDGTYLLPVTGDNPKVKGLLVHPGASPYAKAVRSIYASAFRASNLRASIPKLKKTLDKMISIIESTRKDGPINLQTLFVSMTLDTIGAIAFDENFGGLDKSGELLNLFLAVGHVAKEEFFFPLKRIYCKMFPNSKAGRYRTSVITRLRDEWKKIVDRLLVREDPEPGQTPIWYGLKYLADPNTKKRVSHDILVQEIGSLVAAGIDTTGFQLGWIFALLATRPDIVKKMLDELEQHGLYGKDAREVQFEDLSDLVYLTAVIKEGMRVADISLGPFPRRVPRDMTILGYRVPKGTILFRCGSRAFNIDVDMNDPENFKPERWFNDDGYHLLRIPSFSLGPRDCIGQKLAMLEMRVATIALVKKYELSLVGKYTDLVENTVSGLVIEAKDGIWLNLKPREVSS